MSKHFRVEKSAKYSSRVLVYAKDKDHLPLEKDWDQRFCFYFEEARPVLDEIHNFVVRPDDVWLVVHQKCGTTWMTELLWLLTNRLDFSTATSVDQEERCRSFEYSSIFPSLKLNSMEMVASSKSPRLIRSHLPMHMLPKGLWTVKPKIIYVARDPEDAAVSLYHHRKGLAAYQPTAVEDFATKVVAGEVCYGPIWEHILEFWAIRNEPNVLFTSFERMKKDLKSVVEQVAEFLEKDIAAEEMVRLLEYLSFDQMKGNRTCNHKKETEEIQELSGSERAPFRFIRKGQVGSAKQEINAETLETLARLTEEYLKPYGVTAEEILLN